MTTTSELLTTREAAAFLKLCPTSLRRWRRLGIGPQWLKIGPRAVRYSRADLDQYLSDQTTSPS